MNNKYVGFFGVDKYDVILYIASLISCADKKILLVDYSENKALSYSVQKPMNLDTEIYSTRIKNVDFLSADHINAALNYDYVFIDFGFNYEHVDVDKCQCYISITDQQIHNIESLKKLNPFDIGKAVIILSGVNYKIDSNFVAQQLNLKNNDKMFFVYDDNVNTIHKLDCLYTNKISFKRCSKDFKAMIFGIVDLILSEDTQDIKKLYRLAERRR